MRKKSNELFVIDAYHGTPSGWFESFDYAYCGSGDDQYGSGFYLSSNEDVAKQYVSGDIGIDGEVLTTRVTLQNPIFVDGSKHANLRDVLNLTKIQAKRILVKSSALYIDKSSAESMNPLGDYFEEFWQVPTTKEQCREFIYRMVDEYLYPVDLTMLDEFFGDNIRELKEAVRDVLGYDGVVVEFKDHKHIIAWFPEQVKISVPLY